jgi:hypothetical protein
MCFAPRFFLFVAFIAVFAQTGHALTLEWGRHPTFQHVGFYDFAFTLVPEINPAWTAVGSCIAAAALILRHSAKFRR